MPWTRVNIDEASARDFLNKEGLRGISYKEAIREAQYQLLESDKDVFLLGEGIDDKGGAFGTTKGLCEIFGSDRVMDTPIAENGLTGIAIGASIAGMKPIFIHMRMDFLPMAMDQIVNHAAKWYYMSGGRVNVPLVIRSIIGRGWGSAAQHSQALHSLFLSIPGLKIVAPSTPYDAKGLLISAVRDGNPVMFVEHRWIYDYIGYVPEEMYTVKFGKGVIRRKGSDVTLVAISMMVYEAMKAAKILESQGIDVEVIDPITIKPMDEELIFDSIKKTGALVIADVACKTGGVGAEIACRASEEVLDYLKAPIKRINFPDFPTPCSPVLEAAYYPDYNDICTCIKELIHDK
jgi:pyruvate dehydrogenase E1 component beta subunit